MIMMRLSVLFILCQLGNLVFGGGVNTEFTEIDLIIPRPNNTYEMSGLNEFPIVWAVRNPSVWSNKTFIRWVLENTTQPAIPDTNRTYEGTATFRTNETADGTGIRFATAGLLLSFTGTYNLSWHISNKDAECNQTPAAINVPFSTKPDGDLSSFGWAVDFGCLGRVGLAFNIANTTDRCHSFDQDDPFPDPDPCALKVPEEGRRNITDALNDRYNEFCEKYYLEPLCDSPQSKKSRATQLDAGLWMLGLPVLALLV